MEGMNPILKKNAEQWLGTPGNLPDHVAEYVERLSVANTQLSRAADDLKRSYELTDRVAREVRDLGGSVLPMLCTPKEDETGEGPTVYALLVSGVHLDDPQVEGMLPNAIDLVAYDFETSRQRYGRYKFAGEVNEKLADKRTEPETKP